MRITTAIMLSLLSISAQAGLFDRKLKVFQCTSSKDAYSCSESCEKTNVEVDFTVDKQANKVMMNIYSDGKDDRSVMLENCFVFDNKNFKCGDGIKSLGSGFSSFEDRTLKNGKYVSVYSLTPSSSLDHFSCAK